MPLAAGSPQPICRQMVEKCEGKVAVKLHARAPCSAGPSVDARPSDAAVGRAVHDVLAGGQAAAALVHRRHVNPATALQVACDLDVADEAGVELDAVQVVPLSE